MIKIDKDTKLTAANLCAWYELWSKDLTSLRLNREMYLNRDSQGRVLLKLPFAKKLSITSAAAAMGEGITLSPPAKLSGTQEKTYKEMEALFKKQTMLFKDAKIIKDGCIYGRAYELAYMSNDTVPVPKTAIYPATNAFVVYDDTVEDNSLYGVLISEYLKDGDKKYLRFQVYDSENLYEISYDAGNFKSGGMGNSGGTRIEGGIPHNMGRMPLTEYSNNDEQQGDFEQVIALMRDRTTIHDLNIKDMTALPKNTLKTVNVELAGATEEEKVASRKRVERTQMLSVKTPESLDGSNTPYEAGLMSKPENYSSIDVYGKDVDSKIYDLTLIPDLSSDQFAGNASGVALELKLMPFKKMVEAKDPHIERLVRRRLKMYVHALSQREGFEIFDAADVEITINRNWTENLIEIAQMISTLMPTGLFSDEYLTNLMPDADYIVEKERKQNEQGEKRKAAADNPDPNNAGVGDMNSILRNLLKDESANGNPQ